MMFIYKTSGLVPGGGVAEGGTGEDTSPGGGVAATVRGGGGVEEMLES
jgi:hypothetical protein